jgi:hypothetical protein
VTVYGSVSAGSRNCVSIVTSVQVLSVLLETEANCDRLVRWEVPVSYVVADMLLADLIVSSFMCFCRSRHLPPPPPSTTAAVLISASL